MKKIEDAVGFEPRPLESNARSIPLSEWVSLVDWRKRCYSCATYLTE